MSDCSQHTIRAEWCNSASRLIRLIVLFIQCVARKVPELCKGYTPGKSENDLHIRIARLERIIERAFPNSYEEGFSDRGSPTPQGEGRSRASSPADPATQGGSLQVGGAYFGNSALGSVSSMPILEQVRYLILN